LRCFYLEGICVVTALEPPAQFQTAGGSVAEAFQYLFEGKVWIDAKDYAVVRIDGHPAKKLSFWIQRADFARQYQKIDGFWLPQRDMTFVDVRLYGKKVLTIDHHDYSVNSSLAVDASVEKTQSF
jgi:hypothetical protein